MNPIIDFLILQQGIKYDFPPLLSSICNLFVVFGPSIEPVMVQHTLSLCLYLFGTSNSHIGRVYFDSFVVSLNNDEEGQKYIFIRDNFRE